MAVVEKELRSLLGADAWKEEFRLINQGGKTIPRPQDVHHHLNMSLEKLYNGTSIRIRAEKKTPCTNCISRPISVKCGACRGSGYIGSTILCSICKGTKQVSRGWCGNPKCQGGIIREEKLLTVKVPIGALNGQKIILEGEGDALVNHPTVTSDIVCTINEIAHERFRRCGNDLYHVKSINITQSLCGCSFPLKHLDERTILVKSKKGVVIRPGDMKIIKNEGMPIQGSKSKSKGDLILIFNILFPPNIDVSSITKIESFFPERSNVDIPDESEDCNLVAFDPKEQIYQVPFRQTAYMEDSPIKKPTAKEPPRIPTCAQQ